ncbi:MAG: hypothetical protein QW505_06680, partial [Thermoplasmata archaeon]
YVTGADLISEFDYGVFSPPHADHGEYTNSHGRYDYLVVEASVEVSCAGWYEVDGFLYDSLNNLIDQATVNVYLTMGTHAVPLSFSGIAIFNNGMDGPYGVYLYLSDGVGPLGGGSHTTSAYLQTEFEQPSHFEPPHSDDGYDANGNGLYDALVLYATVNASEEDWYYVFAELYDGASNLICSDGWDHVYLSAGLNSVQFSFDWKMIYAHGVDGPYTVHMYLENDSWVPLDSDSHVTRAYLLSEFEHVFYSPPYSDYGVDSNGNGLYDELIVEMSVDVSSSGWFWLYAELTDGFGTTIDYDGAYEVFLIAGSNNFAFSFDGIDIYNSGIDGPYNVEMEIYDSWPYGTLLNSDAYATSPYLYVEFEQLSHFSPPHADIGVDTNSNGQYDNLIVTAYVSATTDGWYTVYGDLYDANGTWIDSASVNVYLFAGLNFIDLSFSGIAIFINGVDGPYVVDLDLYDSHGWCDSDVHMTAAYLYTEFEHFGASFAPPHSDYGVDNDGNGFYDELAVEVNVDVLADGYYMIDYALTDNSSNWIDGGSIYISLSAGLNVIDISFSWENIFCHGADGPYFVNIQIYVWDSGWRFLDADTHKTNPYLLSDFEYAVLSPPHSDYGVDSNSNGFYEQLNVDIVVEVSYEGTYRIVANLYDGTSNWMDYAETLTYLVGGTNVVTMSFAGMKIFAHGVDGPYRVDIQLYDDLPWMPHLFDTDVHFTSGYLAKEFEGAAFSPPHSDYGDDTDSNGLYNYLVVEATVEVSSDGRFWVQGTLYDNTSSLIEDVYVNAYLTAGTNTVRLNFTGMFIYRNGVAGPFIVELSLYDDTWALLDSDVHMTGPYAPTDFEYAVFSPPHLDYGLDTNSNGLYDELVVEANVYISSEEGWYWLDASLYDAFGHQIGWDSESQFLSVGTNVVQFSFGWQRISQNGVGGPYYIYLTLAEISTWRTLDNDFYTTAAYMLSEFETASFSPPHADHGEDSDMNGLYEELVIDAAVYVSSDGWYWVTGDLRDSLNHPIYGTSVNVYLTSGSNVVGIPFPWQSIYVNGVDGPYIAYLNLYDDSWNPLDSDTYLTSAYAVTDFEYAVLSPPHSDYGYDVDGNGLYDWLVVDVAVSVSTDGLYRVQGRLFDTLSNEIGSASVAVDLFAGMNIVSVLFSGFDIYNNGVNGPFIVQLELTDDLWLTLDSGTHATGPYLAIDFDSFAAHLAPPHADRGDDMNGNGLYDELYVDVEVSILTDGFYQVQGYLYDSLMNNIGFDSRSVYLTAGFQTVTLWFSGVDIFANGVDGPFTVYLYLYDDWGTLLDSDTHTTSAYLYTEFEHSSQLSPPHSDYGADTNGNGFYDVLVVEVVIDVTTAGWHYVLGFLLDIYTNTIGTDDNYTYLDLGLQIITLEFSGQSIYGNGVDGPYYVYLMLRDSFGNWVDDDYHTTLAYTYDEFEPLGAVFMPPHSDFGVDTNGNGLYNVLVLNVSVYVMAAGGLWVIGQLFDGGMNLIDSTYNYADLDTGAQMLTLSFSSMAIYVNGADGPYLITLSLYDTSWGLLDNDTHMTNAYLYTEFEKPSQIEPPYSDYVEDTNGNGLHDWLIIEFNVNITTAGWYHVSGDLYDGSLNWISYADDYVYLGIGVHTLTLSYPGPSIYLSAADGPYLIYLNLYDDSWNWLLDSDVYATAIYLYAEFEHSSEFQPPHSDYGIET